MPDKPPVCDNCLERTSSKTFNRTLLNKEGGDVMCVTVHVCEECTEDDAAWAKVILVGSRALFNIKD